MQWHPSAADADEELELLLELSAMLAFFSSRDIFPASEQVSIH
jgi:hypothetical protein